MNYKYNACNRAGQHFQGTIEAASRQEAARQIRQQGLWVTKLTSAADRPVSQGQSVGSLFKFPVTSFNTEQQALFFRQLAVLTEAGIPLHEALKNLAETVREGRCGKVISDLYQAVIEGNSLSAALGKYPRIFSLQVVHLVQAGENGGTLDIVLVRLADYLEQNTISREKLKSVLLYPVILACSAVGALVFMTLVILPAFASMLENLQVELPLPTRILLAASGFLQDYGWAALLVSILFLLGLTALGRLSKVRLCCERCQLAMPLLGKLRLHTDWMLALSTMAALLEQGIALPLALEMSGKSLRNTYLAQQLEHVQQKIQQGSSLRTALGECDCFPPILQEMLAAGEQSGRLETMLAKGADYCKVMMENESARLQALAEPVAIFLVGGLVFFFVLSVIMPLLNTMDALTM